jgi:hypothetical protein
MKKLILLFALSLPAHAIIAYTAGTACGSITTVASQACLVGPVNAGDLIWIGLSWAGGGCMPTMTVADGVNTYSAAGTDSQAGSTSAKSAIRYTIATTTATITATATNGGGCFITVLPAVVTGQAVSSFVGETLQANSTSATSCTIGFTRTGTQLMTIAGNYNVAGLDVGWNTTGSTGTFTLGAKISNGNVSQPGASASQRVTSGTTVNGVLATTGAAGGFTCNGFSINEAGTGPGPQHRVSQ